MNEAGWRACTDPRLLLHYLGGLRAKVPADASLDRKLRLFACACCRRVRPSLPSVDSRRAVETADLFADGLVSKRKLRNAEEAARQVPTAMEGYWDWRYRDFQESTPPTPSLSPSGVAVAVVGPDAFAAALHVLQAVLQLVPSEGEALSALVRDVFGNPFRPATVHPSCLAWHGGTVRKIAQRTYEERRFADLPLLADALEEAGCDHADVLFHCRGGGEHVRGCWVVDLLRGEGKRARAVR